MLNDDANKCSSSQTHTNKTTTAETLTTTATSLNLPLAQTMANDNQQQHKHNTRVNRSGKEWQHGELQCRQRYRNRIRPRLTLEEEEELWWIGQMQFVSGWNTIIKHNLCRQQIRQASQPAMVRYDVSSKSKDKQYEHDELKAPQALKWHLNLSSIHVLLLRFLSRTPLSDYRYSYNTVLTSAAIRFLCQANRRLLPLHDEQLSYKHFIVSIRCRANAFARIMSFG